MCVFRGQAQHLVMPPEPTALNRCRVLVVAFSEPASRTGPTSLQSGGKTSPWSCCHSDRRGRPLGRPRGHAQLVPTVLVPGWEGGVPASGLPAGFANAGAEVGVRLCVRGCARAACGYAVHVCVYGPCTRVVCLGPVRAPRSLFSAVLPPLGDTGPHSLEPLGSAAFHGHSLCPSATFTTTQRQRESPLGTPARWEVGERQGAP